MSDPLTLLRTYHVNQKEIIERDGYVIFDDVSWPKTTKTNYLTYGSGKDGNPKDYYSLECLLFLLKNVHIPNHPEYVRQAVAQNLPVVRRPDRKDLLAYLNGKTSVSNSIDKTAPMQIPTKVKRTAQDDFDAGSAKKPRIEYSHLSKIKQQMAAKLDAPKETSVTLDNIKSLSESMSVEKIAAIKAKRLAKKRTTIKQNDDLDVTSIQEGMQIMEVEDETKVILGRERHWRNRNNILQSQGKIFAENVFAILQSIKARETVKPVEPTPRSIMDKPTPAKQAPVGYNRYDQERFKVSKEVEMFSIDPTKSFHHDKNRLQQIQSLLEGSEVKSLPKVKSEQKKPFVPPPRPSSLLPVSAAKFTPQQATQNKRTSRTPIIIVPASFTALINMFNAKDILQDFKFVSADEYRSKGCKREVDILIQRCKNDNITVPYRVLDNPQKLSNDDWDRVVAVFINGGVAWQFKGWPFGGQPVEIFSKICGFYLKYDELPTDPKVANWAVNIINLSKTKRHLDRAAIMKFWEVLDRHLVKNKRHLRF